MTAQQFIDGEQQAVETVQGWVEVVVRGRWGLSDPGAATQEIILELVRLGRAGRIRTDTDFRSFVSTVARHSCVDLLRRQKLRTPGKVTDNFFEMVPDPGPDPEAASKKREELEQVRFVFQALEPDCRRIIGWAFADSLSSATMGERLGISAGNVRVRLHRCVTHARRLLRSFLTGEE